MHILRRIVGVLVLVTLALALYFFVISQKQDVPPHIVEGNLSSGLPSRLKIPSIGVDAHVEHLGTTSSGDMDTPKGPDNVAWFNQGPRPGEKGSSVIDGHYGWKNDIPAVFDSLEKVKIGDKLYVEDSDGVTTTFVVREIRAYGPNESATDVFISSDGKAHLNLITCGGTWNASLKSYSKRVVVLSDKE